MYQRWESDIELEEFRESGPDGGPTAELLDAQVRKYRVSGTEDS